MSPLYLYSARRGLELLSESSAVGLVATDASDDDRQILFTTHVGADGARGDLHHAYTRDVAAATELLHDIPMNFPSGPCRPLAIFAGTGHDQYPVAAYCPGSDRTATLSKWVRGRRVDLVTGIAIEMPFTLDMNPQRDTFLLSLADGRIVTATDDGRITTVDQGKIVRGALNRRGNAVYATGAVGARELRVAHRRRGPQTISPLAILFQNSVNRNGHGRSRLLSPDGSLALFGATPGPFGGTTGDINLVDVDTGELFPLEGGVVAFPNAEIFTADSRFAFWLDILDPANGIGRLMIGDRDGARPLGPSTTVWDAFRATGGRVTYNESPVFDAQNFELSTADLFVADSARPDDVRLISAAAFISYLPTPDHERVVFGSEQERDGPGLYVARAR